MFSFKTKSRALLVFGLLAYSQAKADFFGPMYTCAGPYACLQASYLGVQFPDGSHQITAATAALIVGTIDSGTPAANGGSIAGGALLFQSASATAPGLVNNTTQTLSGVKTFSSAPNLSSLSASQALATDGSKNVISLAFASNSGTSNLVSRDSSGNMGAASVLAGNASAATNAVLIFKGGHLKSTIVTAPTAAPNANAGTGATCSVVNATDAAGTINLTTTAVSPGSGAICAVSFNAAYGIAPICIVTPANDNAALFAVASGIYNSTSTSALTINFAVTDATGHAYVWSYYCVETQ